jgi:hypothetical protein
LSKTSVSAFSLSPTFDRGPLDLLPDVFLLLSLEGELDEDLLELLVDIVDAQLLETVVLEDLKPAACQQRPPRDALDVEHADDVFGGGLWLHRYVDSTDDPLEQVVVPGVSGEANLAYRAFVKASLPEDAWATFCGTSYIEPDISSVTLAPTSPTATLSLHGPCQEDLLQLRRVALHQVLRKVGDAGVSDGRIPVVSFDELDVAQPEDRRKDSKNGVLLVWRKADHSHGALPSATSARRLTKVS